MEDLKSCHLYVYLMCCSKCFGVQLFAFWILIWKIAGLNLILESHWEVRGFPHFQRASALHKAATISFHMFCSSLFIDCSVMQHDNPSTSKCEINKVSIKQFVACFCLSCFF